MEANLTSSGGVQSCPVCGGPLSPFNQADKLCPTCLIELALESPGLMAELQEADHSETLVFADDALAPGSVRGNRYRIRSSLGQGGMGEVWRAYDLKLRLDVALKSVRSELGADGRFLEALRQEVRTARAVVSANVCRVFDLEEIDGDELVSMEYVDGTTLADVLTDRSPLDLAEAQEIAAQFLAGLEAIHGAGLVHRDIKPENLMVTRTGRVVVMDFGLAKSSQAGRSGVIAGTPAYMSPEQATGAAPDPRADVWAAGVVLAEMVHPGGVREADDRRRFWEAVRRQPPELGSTPWSPALERALAPAVEDRYASAAAFARALEAVALRADGDDERRPYPGLASFTSADAEYFFGRELEAEEMWRKLRRPHLLALIGPSGAGKSSFLRAGLLRAAPSGWRAIVAAPGDRPFVALGRALASELADDEDLLDDFVRFAEPDVAISLFERWRRRHRQALVIVDQFEELFTQNRNEVQEAFATLVSRLSLEADVHVLLSMRDDFLFRCADFEALTPIFSELTPLKALTEAALRRVLVQPALKCGYRFEDDALVDEMIGEVSGERGVLPLLAFAASRLWELRDRERGLLTREAYEHVGGVGGALAQHAEATLETIGHDRLPLVRELFRNLVTPEGTRATRDRTDLLSIFEGGDREGAAEVLAALVDARLLTSYEAPGDPDEGTPGSNQLEVIHESLLSAWPRLVRWQAQDAEGALMREQVRQAAKLWEERGRSEDLLWTGAAYREFVVWRDRYAGKLTYTEQAFADAVVDLANRQRRRRRIAIAAAFLIALAVAGATSLLWRESEAARRQAVEAERQASTSERNAVAMQLLALARVEEERHPTAALAFLTKSLEMADTEAARRLVVKTLWRGPVATILPTAPVEGLAHPQIGISPDGEWIACSQPGTGEVLLYSRDGRVETVIRAPPFDYARYADFGPDSDTLVLHAWPDPVIYVYSIPDGALIHQFEPTTPDRYAAATVRGDRIRTISFRKDWSTEDYRVRFWPLRGGEPGPRHTSQNPRSCEPNNSDVHPTEDWIACVTGREIFRIEEPPDESERLIGTRQHGDNLLNTEFSPQGDRLLLRDSTGRMTIWSVDGETARRLQTTAGTKQQDVFLPKLDTTSSWAAWASSDDRSIYLWDLAGLPDAGPVPLGKHDEARSLNGVFDPRGRWLATQHYGSIAFWPLDGAWSRRIEAGGGGRGGAAFTADGRFLALCMTEQAIWPTRPGDDPPHIESCAAVAAHPTRPELLQSHAFDPAVLVSTVDWTRRPLGGGRLEGFCYAADIDPSGRLGAVGCIEPHLPIRIWSLDTGEQLTSLRPNEEGGEEHNVDFLRFLGDGSLLSAGDGGVLHWDLEAGTKQLLYPSERAWIDVSPDDRKLLIAAGEMAASQLASTKLLLFDLEDRTHREITSHGDLVQAVAFHPSGELILTGDAGGVVRIGPANGDEPHLLVGHEESIRTLTVSPDRRWIISSTQSEIRQWPMPDLSRPPLHTLPIDELLAELHSLTNVRVVEDPATPDGWRLDVGPFKEPSWRTAAHEGRATGQAP